VLCEHPTIGPVAQRYAAIQPEGLRMVAQDMGHMTEQALEADRFLNAINQLLATEEIIILDSAATPVLSHETDKVIGWVLKPDLEGKQHIALFPETTRRKVEELLGRNALGGITNNSLYDQLARMDKLIKSADGKSTTTKKYKGNAERVLIIRDTAIKNNISLLDDDNE